MSAICGVCWLDGRPVERADIEGMTASLAHRGPDGAGLWYDGPVGLGHQMLWTTPESLKERLPLAHGAGDLVLTADARIDNRGELLGSLDLGGRPAGEIGDGELILAAYAKWGECCPEYLLGDFSFAVWDGYKQVLFCARDHFGIKPFYYYYRPGVVFAFASEIKALLALPWVPCRLNEVRVADYLDSLVEDKTITFYQEILRLPPAHSVLAACEGLRFREYWALDPSREIRYDSDEAYAEAFREVFFEAVRCRLRSAFPVGFALSGGLDSSSVVCVARELLAGNGSRPLQAFSAVFDDVPECDERAYIDTILAQGSVESHHVHPDRLSALGDIDEVLWGQDQPFFIRNLFLWRALFDAAQQQGVRVMLDGEDGDTVISYGEGYLAELACAGEWAAFAGEARALAEHFAEEGVSAEWWLRVYGFPHLTRLARAGRWRAFAGAADQVSRHFALSRWQLYWGQGLKPVAPEPVRRVWRALRGGGQPEGDDGSLLSDSLAKRVGFAEREERLLAPYMSAFTQREEHWQSLVAGITSCVHEEDNKAAAAFGIEPRHPFWDKRVVEFCLSLPPEQKLRQGWPRWILRRAMTGILPREVQWRVGKSDLSANFDRSLMGFERSRLEELLVKDPQYIEEYVNLTSLHEAYRRGEADAVWAAAILALWLRQIRTNERWR